MSKNYAIIIQCVLPLTTFCRLGAQRSDVYKQDLFVMSWRFHNRAWQQQSHKCLPETSGTLWIHLGALSNQRCSLATGCGITVPNHSKMYRGANRSVCTYFLDMCTNRVNHFDGLVQDCSNSSALAMELLQSCTKPSICKHSGHQFLSGSLSEGSLNCFYYYFFFFNFFQTLLLCLTL